MDIWSIYPLLHMKWRMGVIIEPNGVAFVHVVFFLLNQSMQAGSSANSYLDAQTEWGKGRVDLRGDLARGRYLLNWKQSGWLDVQVEQSVFSVVVVWTPGVDTGGNSVRTTWCVA